VTNVSLAQSYLSKAQARLKVLQLLADERAWSDVVCEAQEVVELALKGMLRQVAVEPPKIDDVSAILREHAARFPDPVAARIPRLAEISAWLRKEREFAFYGDVDFIPTEQYSEREATRAREDARFVVETAASVIPERDDIPPAAATEADRG